MQIDVRNSVIDEIKTGLGIAELGFLNFTPEIRNALSAKFAKTDMSSYPDYLKNTTELRSDPVKFHPWSKSAIIAAIPFNNVPDIPTFLKPADDPELAGKVAGYAIKQDYHTFGKELLAKFAEKLQHAINHLNAYSSVSDRSATQITIRGIKSAPTLSYDTAIGELAPLVGLNCEIRTEISVDTAPVAERTLALLSGIGRIGLNSCVLTPDNGSGCFIGEIFTDAEFTKNSTLTNKQEKNRQCSTCGQCIKKCPTGALSTNSDFNYSRCRSNLTIEKRGLLTLEEEKLIGEWIFGCDICTACCPGTILPSPYEVDLEWLLLCPSSELKRAIKGTAIEYTGVTNLRRNAIVVLRNRNTAKTDKLLQKFSKQTGSALLKQCINVNRNL